MATHQIAMGLEPISLLELNNLVSKLITTPDTCRRWVTAELSDVATRGHCYMELIQKDEAGRQVAKARGVIWANNIRFVTDKFTAATGQQLSTGLKVMVCVTASMHPVFGYSLVISDINPEYTMGDLLRRRNEILARLKQEGILDNNRQLTFSDVPQRIAIISAPGAAGYGDFINQLYRNPYRLRFKTQLFAAIMQGNQAASSIIAALERIMAEQDDWDCVVIIRGGGASSDLQGFEDYDLAANICEFPLPVIVGIGHDRDTTLLDYVAFKPVKTPTAAAEWLISIGKRVLDLINDRAQQIMLVVGNRIASQKEQLSYYQGILPLLPGNVSRQYAERLNHALMAISTISSARIAPVRARLDVMASQISSASANCLTRCTDRIDAAAQLLQALSPQAVLNRGFSITRANGVAITDSSKLESGTEITTTLASGTITSVIK